MKTRAVVQVIAIVVLLGAAGWLFSRHFTAKPKVDLLPVRCASCEHEFVPEQPGPDPECPRCHARGGLHLDYCHCNDCGETFLAYEEDSKQGLIREPGGEWTTLQEFVPQSVPCPKCSSANTIFVKSSGKAAASETRSE